MTQPYTYGMCPQCGTQLMVKDARRRWASTKPSFRQAYLIFESGTKVKTVICADCLQNPDMGKLIEAITHDGSQAHNPDTLAFIKAEGMPVNFQPA